MLRSASLANHSLGIINVYFKHRLRIRHSVTKIFKLLIWLEFESFGLNHVFHVSLVEKQILKVSPGFYFLFARQVKKHPCHGRIQKLHLFKAIVSCQYYLVCNYLCVLLRKNTCEIFQFCTSLTSCIDYKLIPITDSES